MGAFNANSFPDGRRGRARTGDTSRVADYAASTLPVPGPGMVGRRFPQGSTVRPLPVRASGGGTPTTPPLTVKDASTKDNPGRVRVYNGRLGGLLPDEMELLDLVLPDGTDNHCYLTLQNGTNLVYGKVLVDGDTGLYTSAHVYVVTSPEDPDGDWVYLLIATLTYDGTSVTLASQDATGNQSLKVSCSADGTILQPFWGSVNAS